MGGGHGDEPERWGRFDGVETPTRKAKAFDPNEGREEETSARGRARGRRRARVGNVREAMDRSAKHGGLLVL